MLSDLQKKKLSHLFRVMDKDGNGRLEWSDHERVAAGIASFRDYRPGSDGYASVVDLFRHTWDLSEPFQEDGTLTLERWLDYQDHLLGSDDAYYSVVRRSAERTFDTFDVDGDGQISLTEWQSFLHCYGIDEAHVYDCFLAFDTNRDGFLSRGELVALTREFYLGSDETAAGNLLFGPLE